nr:syntaxin-43-like [Tanacetum cinerariifolium]
MKEETMKVMSHQYNNNSGRSIGPDPMLLFFTTKALMPSFGDGKEDHHMIEALTYEVVDLVKKSEKKLRKLSAGGPLEDSTEAIALSEVPSTVAERDRSFLQNFKVAVMFWLFKRIEDVSSIVPLMLIEPQARLISGPDPLQKPEEGHKVLVLSTLNNNGVNPNLI